MERTRALRVAAVLMIAAGIAAPTATAADAAETPWVCTGTSDTVGECSKVSCDGGSHVVGVECTAAQKYAPCGSICIGD